MKKVSMLILATVFVFSLAWIAAAQTSSGVPSGSQSGSSQLNKGTMPPETQGGNQPGSNQRYGVNPPYGTDQPGADQQFKGTEPQAPGGKSGHQKGSHNHTKVKPEQKKGEAK